MTTTRWELRVEFITPAPLNQGHGEAIWHAGATRFAKVLGQRDRYSATLTTEPTTDHVEDLIADAMDLLRKALPDFAPSAVRAVTVHVTELPE